MRRVVWLRPATLALNNIHDVAAADRPIAAGNLRLRLIAAADSLATHPYRGRKVRGGVRELTFVWPYLIRYAVEADTVVILTIRHGARRPLR